jgi:hypothetical protein
MFAPRAVVAGPLLMLPVLPPPGARAVMVAPLLDARHGMGRVGPRPVLPGGQRPRQRERRQASQHPTPGVSRRERTDEGIEGGWVHDIVPWERLPPQL